MPAPPPESEPAMERTRGGRPPLRPGDAGITNRARPEDRGARGAGAPPIVTPTEYGARLTPTEYGARLTPTEHGARLTPTEHGARLTPTEYGARHRDRGPAHRQS